MAGSYTFHNKFHRANHHSLITSDQIDAGLDPIASREYPFLGIFYNTLTDQERTYTIETNSFQWWSVFTTVLGNSASWMLTRSLYTTVSSLSNNWNYGYQGYTTLSANSANWHNSYTTISSFSAEWGSPYLMFTNKPQVYTHSKTFSGQYLQIDTLYPGMSTMSWNLNTQQVAFINLEKNLFLNNPEEDTKIEGGLYTLVIRQKNNLVPNVGYDIEFDNLYRFNGIKTFNNVVTKTLSGITIINFICVEGFMLGDVTYLSGNI